MIRGVYSSASGMLAESLRTDVTANNLANANTTGYKKDVAVNKDFASLLIKRINDGQEENIGRLGVGVQVDEVVTMHDMGVTRVTGNPLDLAIEGKGFFAVETPTGVCYTRNGNFTRDSLGQLVTQDGYRVLGQGGAIQLDGSTIIGQNGSVRVTLTDDDQAEAIEVGQLQFVEFDNEKQLRKIGDSLYVYEGEQPPAQASGIIQQGMLEGSNVNVVTEMVNMITGYRAYEISAKVVQTHDTLLDKAANEVGRV
ncbi:flagellar basal-body rod protein FlgF [Acetonema longum]|uniref:Flagellar basal-body rod protein FlgF n=1 Tax=Acetonema longum DSM 6540 TaxID=1009370 RepID=F7NIU9_9FIRM|nr:flagellar basal-body rod protein FlgF [Acetonema longum]EGO64072.1 flagellar basal-body rod protein FlgF [Acetonema longum DSM 6540]